VLAPAAAAAQHFPADEDLAVMLRYLVEDGATPGIVLGIIEADGTRRVLSHGDAGPGARPLGPRSGFEIGSINKTFTAALLADMVARGEVALDDPVSRHLPASVRVPSRGREITLLDLAAHHSGLPRLPDNHVPADPADPYADLTVEKVYAFLAGHQLRREPGTEFEYSNLGMGLLGHALARAAGAESFRTLLVERIVRPLGLEATDYPGGGEMEPWMTKGHDARGNVVPYWDLTDVIAGAGGLRSHVEDMLTYLGANMGPPETDLERAIRSTHTVRKQISGDRAIGLGWLIQEHEGRPILMHGGGTAGFNTLIAFDPERRVGFVQLTNTGDFRDDLGLDFLRRGPPLAIPTVEVPRGVLARYAGLYEPAPGRTIVVRLEDDGHLTVRTPGNVRFRMYAESDTSFFLKRSPWRVRFTRDASGEVTGLVLNPGDADRPARRVSGEVPPANASAVRDLPLPEAEAARYAGTYTLQAGGRALELRVFAEDGQLRAQAQGQAVTRLRYQGDHAFVHGENDDVRLVFTVEGGRARSVTLHQGGRAVEGTRAP
jgi:serine-type D-Ala-D-Ala carboxypeptidase/endopeptidase